MRANPYSRYKASGVEWLGDMPAHWEAKRLKTSATYFVSNVDKVPSEEELPVRLCNYTDVYYNDRIRPDMGLMETTATADEIRRFGLRVGDVMITKDSEEWSDIAVPALVVESAPDLVCGYHLAIIRPRQDALLGRFLLRAMQACAVNQQFQIAATGVTRYGLPKSSIGEAWLPLPPLQEQTAISDFLDRETAKINTLVAKKRTLIERLKEKRAALVSRTVTRGLPPDAARAVGLDPHPKLKPSGIDWLGDVPEHWTIKRMGDELEFVSYGFTNPMPTTNEGPFMVTANDINDGRVLFDTARYTSLEDFEKLTRKSKPQCRDILVTKDGTLGRVAVVDSRIPFCINQSVALLRPKPSANERFIAMALQSPPYFDRMVFEAGGTTIKHIYITRLARMPIAVPPVPEQSAIAARLDLETAKIDAMVAKIETAIERLHEYRTALITAAVTGKIDVRGETADNRQELVSAS